AEEAHDRALRRSAAERQLELDRFVDSATLEASRTSGEALREGAAAWLAGDDDEEAPGAADVSSQHASVERVEAHTAPSPPDHEGERRQRRPDAVGRAGSDERR